MMFWLAKNNDLNVIPPEKNRLEYGKVNPESPYIGTPNNSRYNVHNYKPKISDCPPLRYTSRYGFEIRCPSDITFERVDDSDLYEISETYSIRHGIKVSGESCSYTDSLKYGSWIKGGEYIKIVTGIIILCPINYLLMQSSIINCDFVGGKRSVTGIEYFHSGEHIKIGEDEYFKVEINVIFPFQDDCMIFKKGELISCVYPLLRPSEFNIKKLEF